MVLNRCPDLESLRQLLRGKIPSPQAEVLQVHLLECEKCTAAAGAFPGDDDLSTALRFQLDLRGDEEIVDRVIERGKQLRTEIETARPEETKAGWNGDSESASPRDGIGRQGSNLEEYVSMLADAEQPDEIGRLGGYRVLQVMGAGGMGIVFRAEDPKLERAVALKVMKPSVAASRLARDRFLREARAAAAIEHDNVVSIYQVGEDRGIPFIAMRYLRGQSLQERLAEETKLDPKEAATIGKQVAAGLAAAHKRGLIHRDIKPDNIWIEDGTQRIKILDFGLARSHDADSGITQSGMVLGTPRYMSPEQAKAETVDHRSDLFSLGSVLYHLISGEAPFNGGSLTATLIKVTRVDYQPLSSVCPKLNARLSNLIARLLAKEPDQRPQTAGEVANCLAEIETEIQAERTEQEHRQRNTETNEFDPLGFTVDQPVAESEDRARTQPSRLQSITFSRLPIHLVVSILTIAFVCIAVWSSGLFVQIGTERGTLVVHVLGEEFETNVKGKTMIIRNVESGVEYKIDLNTPQESEPLKPGNYEFIVSTSDGLRSHTSRFEIVKDDTTRLQVWWEPTMIVGEQHSSVTDDLSEQEKQKGIHANRVADGDPQAAMAPFTTLEANQLQRAWAAHADVDVQWTNSIGMPFALIPPGEFQMGATSDEIDSLTNSSVDRIDREAFLGEMPRHQVRLTKPFYFGIHEVTQQQFQTVMGHNPSAFAGMSDHPVEMVSWWEAIEFCNTLSSREGLVPCYKVEASVARIDPAGTGYRLPTEAEWEFAARAGTDDRFTSGDEESHLLPYGWYEVNSGETTHAVGKKRENAFGLYDVHGNVSEWCFDWYDPTFYQRAIHVDPTGPSTATLEMLHRRVLRGGAYYKSATDCRLATRGSKSPDQHPKGRGFRIVRVLKAAASHSTNALSFDGVDDCVEIHSLGFAVEQPMTIEAVVTPQDSEGRERVIVRLQSLQGRVVLGTTENNGKTVFFADRVHHGRGYKIVGPTCVSNRRVHVSVCFRNNTFLLFVNGTPFSETRERPKRARVDAARLLIGGDRYASDSDESYFAGTIDGVRVSRGVRYREPFTPVVRFDADPETLALYRFDTPGEDILRDISGNGHDGKINGATWLRDFEDGRSKIGKQRD